MSPLLKPNFRIWYFIKRIISIGSLASFRESGKRCFLSFFSFFGHEAGHELNFFVTGCVFKMHNMIKSFQLLEPKGAAHLFAAMNYNFFLKNEPDRSGLCPIYLNVRINTKRARIPIDIKINPKNWDKEKRIIVGCAEAADYNLILKQIDSQITNIKINYRLSEIPLTLENFTEQIKNSPPSFDLVQFFYHVIDIQDLSVSTVVKHKGIFSKLKDSKISALFADINLMWFDKYRAYLKSIGNNSSTINTNISIIKKYLKIAKDYGIKIYVDLHKVKVGPTAGRIIWLTEQEINKLENYYFSEFIPDHLKISLGYFLVSCFTGMRISDVLARCRNHFDSEILEFISVKTKTRQLVGISERCRKVINELPSLFIEFKTEVNINLQLKKQIAKTCGIKKNIYFHVARHSFATNYLLKGGKVENLQKLLGHSKIATTMKYVHIIDEDAARTTNLFD